jgi:hypothetical protein
MTNREIFIVLTGVSGNLGDAVIRRRVLSWSRGLGEIHAYVGKTTPGWVEQLGLRPDEKVYCAADRRAWLKKLLLGRGPRALVFDPGEVPLGTAHLRSEAVFLVVAVLMRLRGGVIIRPPRAIAHLAPTTGFLYRLSARLSHVVLWRNVRSLDAMRVGRLSPDTAFHESHVAGLPPAERTSIVISLRGKRSYPPRAWFEGIENFARTQGLTLTVMSQVDEDEERSRELYESLDRRLTTFIPWEGRSDLEQEVAVRALYENAAYVISDRLHVLILASIAGAQPVELVEKPNPKAAEHFDVVGIKGISLDITDKSALDVESFLNSQVGRQQEFASLLDAAWESLDAEVQKIRSLLR